MSVWRTLAHPWDTRSPALSRVRVKWKSVLLDPQPSLLTLRRHACRHCSNDSSVLCRSVSSALSSTSRACSTPSSTTILSATTTRRQNFSLLYKKQENGNLEIRLSPLYDIVSTAYYPELSRDMAMKLGREYSSEKIMPRDFEPLAEEAGLGKAQVKRRVPEFAKTVTGALAKIEIEHSTTEKGAALIRERCEKALNSFKN
jgi:hypothetical protein